MICQHCKLEVAPVKDSAGYEYDIKGNRYGYYHVKAAERYDLGYNIAWCADWKNEAEPAPEVPSDPLAPAKGIVNGLIIAMMVYAAIIFAFLYWGGGR